jgi:hypothetical protein
MTATMMVTGSAAPWRASTIGNVSTQSALDESQPGIPPSGPRLKLDQRCWSVEISSGDRGYQCIRDPHPRVGRRRRRIPSQPNAKSLELAATALISMSFCAPARPMDQDFQVRKSDKDHLYIIFYRRRSGSMDREPGDDLQPDSQNKYRAKWDSGRALNAPSCRLPCSPTFGKNDS